MATCLHLNYLKEPTPDPTNLKVIMLGDIAVGKTYLLKAFIEMKSQLKNESDSGSAPAHATNAHPGSTTGTENHRPLKWKQSIVADQCRRVLEITDTAGRVNIDLIYM